MKTIRLCWDHLKRTEKAVVIVSVILSILMSYQASTGVYGLFSNQGMGPLVMMVAVLQSTFMVGAMRMRSMALNHVLVETLARLRNRTDDGQIPHDIRVLIENFLGDNR